MDADKVTVISLANSTYAHGFNEDEMIHKEEFKKVIELINRQIAKSKANSNDDKYQTNYYNTISVFGERGTGKTSFLHSVINYLRNKKAEDVEIIGIIDPTIIEEKEHVFVLVISLINDIVEKKLNEDDCKKNTISPQQRSSWQKQLLTMAKGLPTLAKIGESKQTPRWQSHEFIMEEGLDIVHSAFQLESEFRKLVNLALEILGKDVFVLMLDDIDVDMCKGWDVLEMLRKYLTTPRIITILSGNLKLYSLNVRMHQWKQLEDIAKIEDADNYYYKIVNELEGQYLIKVLKSENRIHLRTMHESIEVFGAQYHIQLDDEDKVNILDLYKKFFTNHGIKGASQLNVFISYMLRLSVRSQIQFLLNSNSEDNTGLNSVEAFISRLYAANIDVTQTVNNPQMLEHIIQGYIESQESSPDLYLLMPNYPNEDLNACLTAFTILFTEAVSRSNFLIFDYLIRIGYIRNLILGLNTYLIPREDFYKYVGLKQMMSLKNNVGLSIGISDSFGWSESHIRLYGFSDKNKKNSVESQGRLDYETKQNTNLSQRIIAYLPVSVIKNTNNNESRVYYSFYNLLAGIAEILKIQTGDGQKDMAKNLLMNLCQLRTYPKLKDDGVFQENYYEEYVDNTSNDEEESFLVEGKDNSLDAFVNDLVDWSDQYNKRIPPYLLGRIATRMYYPLQKVSGNNLGEKMHRMVIAFLNACLIEECLEYYPNSVNYEGIEKLNRSNAITDDKVFLNNLMFVHRNEAHDSVRLTEWMMKCPLLHAFVKPDFSTSKEFRTYYLLFDSLDFSSDSSYNVYNVLTRVNYIDSPKIKPTFSGSKDKIEETKAILSENGFSLERITDEKIPIDLVIKDLYESKIFDRKPTQNQIIKFRINNKH